MMWLARSGRAVAPLGVVRLGTKSLQCNKVAATAARTFSESATQGSGSEDPKKNAFEKRYGWFLRLMGYYGRDSVNIRTGDALFRSAEEQSSLVALDSAFGLQFDWHENKNFNVRQQLTLLHIWMLHRILLPQGDMGKDVQEAMFDSFWEDTTRRIRNAGVHELTVNKHLTQVQKSCFASAVTYDHSFNITTDQNLELGSALWRNLYSSDPKTPDECVYHMADYVRNQMKAFEELDEKDLFGAKLSWIDLEVENPENQSEWRQSLSSSGATYWWNVKTRESRWTPPPTA